MNEIEKLLLQAEHILIRDIVHQFDPKAIVTLFGAGATCLGKKMDLYIRSTSINACIRKRIHAILTHNYHLRNIDRVCETHNNKALMVMKEIGVNV